MEELNDLKSRSEAIVVTAMTAVVIVRVLNLAARLEIPPIGVSGRGDNG
jgi:hypothetical protein